ncbi:hypothetical protein [Duganella vulcania]|uniref:Lipoprotein n=1 Tax=Duganella vulcania TaxID=2692166 RepID=A0A845GW58_9BURK|nr:hypothetical protein [Duganella vulcania]MYM97562.1 hypothetical protein [Duganella vulcania]
MKNLFIASLSVALLGCAATSHNVTPQSLSDGVWSGTLKSVTIRANDGHEEGQSDLLIASCKGVVRIWAGDGNGAYSKLGSNYVIHSSPDSHLIYFLDAAPKQPDWVEIQTYSLLEIDSETAVLQWSRAVNNRDLARSDDGRYFFSQGTTRLRHVSQACDERLVP